MKQIGKWNVTVKQSDKWNKNNVLLTLRLYFFKLINSIKLNSFKNHIHFYSHLVVNSMVKFDEQSASEESSDYDDSSDEEVFNFSYSCGFGANPI